MNDITSRFIEVYTYLLEQEKVSNPSHFAKMIDISTSMMNEILKGRSNAGINPIQNTVKKFNEISSEWLLTGNGNKLKMLVDNENSSQTIDLVTEVFRLSAENDQLKETNDLLRFKINVLEERNPAEQYKDREQDAYRNVAEPQSELIKKKSKKDKS